MEMHQVRYFLAVCEHRNFTRAAESCNVTQPALTRAVQHLENEFGAPLFHRDRANIRLTDLGRLVRPHMEQIAAQKELAVSTAHGFLKIEKGSLAIGVMCTIGPVRFAGFLSRFRQDNPEVEITIREGVPRQLSEMLAAGEIAAAVMAQPEPFPDPFEVRPLYGERFVAAFPVGHRCEAKAAIVLRDLEGESYLSRANCEFRDAIRCEREALGVSIRYAFRSEHEDWIQSLVAAGMGFSIMPEFSPLLPGIVTRPIVEPEFRRIVSLVTVQGRPPAKTERIFLDGIRRYPWGD